MGNGRAGDHPVSDVVNHKMKVYSPEVDALIREIHKISPEALNTIDWFEAYNHFKITPESIGKLEKELDKIRGRLTRKNENF
jgi:hypothetical protein